MNEKLRGVNFGGWLVLEKWMTPSLFVGLEAEDETSFCRELGENAEQILRQHWETFITAEDIQWLSDIGINAVRIPVGHWLFGDIEPYFGAIDILDNMMSELNQKNIKVILDLHAAPGNQNGEDHGGIKGVCEWHQDSVNIAQTLYFLGRLAAHYQESENLYAIQLLNEPHWDIPIDILKEYYIQGYTRIRNHLSAEKTAIIISDGFRPKEWGDFMKEPDFSNVLIDSHLYQCFTNEEENLDIHGHIQKAVIDRKNEVQEIQDQLWMIIGEWSLGLPEKTFSDHDEFTHNMSRRAYAAAQLISYERCQGWFFWSYKLENSIAPGWDFRECVKRGWLPNNYS
ncbi:MAG: cellulase family glycosylhydrolase [Microcoleaceae cyanobacterium]